MSNYSANSIKNLLQGRVSDFRKINGRVEIKFGDGEFFGKERFLPNSFTFDFFELLEKHLKD